MFATTSVTMADLKLISAESNSLMLAVKSSERPISLIVTPYERGIVVQIPWWAKDKLGSPGYEALRAALRSHYRGSIQTRTETDPKFKRAAMARGEVRRGRQLAAA